MRITLFISIIALSVSSMAAAQTAQNKPKAKTAHSVKKKKQLPIPELIYDGQLDSSAVIVDIDSTVKKDNGPEYDVLADFTGGDQARIKFIASHTKYPQAAIDRNISGMVCIGFMVNKDGSISGCEVLASIGGGCDEAALRAAKLMPRWQPAIKNRKPVKSYHWMPFYFSLKNKQAKVSGDSDNKEDDGDK